MAQTHVIPTSLQPVAPVQWAGKHPARKADKAIAESGMRLSLLGTALGAQQGITKAEATQLFRRVAATSPLPVGKLRAELIPDSSWKRAGRVLGPQASQTAARLAHLLRLSCQVWGNETDALEWLQGPHAELGGATPYSLLKTESGGRAVEALLGALEYGFSA